ncbi:SAM-dependent methyltransferase [Catenovulum maritimum]|uniref:Release factor glutamine methyltransferase n=1 Tax=Catenovulum maritimum TaxID=1513271 RepID=A0A0J8GYW5_9ALTE|nr:peptide chain release factor N(5)-glutamine methyltransferase [Catenovulum maritimum]KMT66434.1 SAM-dependent methyltransferase [Catenovulum maritimum]
MNQSLEQAWRHAASLLTKSDSATLDAQLLLLAAIERESRIYLMTYPETLLTFEQADKFTQLIEQRLTGKPVAHILGIREFWGLPIQVNPSTLIPRPDTETLIDTVLEKYRDRINEPLTVLDLGTGTGAIALALKSECPNWQVHAVEFNPDAFQLAISNSQKLSLDIELHLGSWFSALPKNFPLKFDLIVSNPPYIDENDPHLNQGDVCFEPKSALVADNQGLSDIELITHQAKGFLKPSAYLMFEHGYQQADLVQNIFQSEGYSAIETIKDIAENDRVTLAQNLS